MTSFEEDMRNLHSMFPDLDGESVGEILRDQGGDVERAVEVLLKFCGGSDQQAEQDSFAPPDLTGGGAGSVPDYHSGGSGPTMGLGRAGGGADPVDSGDGDTFAAPSADFLTIGRYMRHAPSVSLAAQSSHSANQQTEYDEALARQLQDTLFLSELQNRPEMRDELYGAWHGEDAGARPITGGGADRGGAAPGEGNTVQSFEGIFGVSTEDIRHRLGRMSQDAKVRLNNLVTQIQGSPARQYAPVYESGERRGGQDDDTEVIAFSREEQQAHRRIGGAVLDDDEGVVGIPLQPVRGGSIITGSGDGDATKKDD